MMKIFIRSSTLEKMSNRVGITQGIQDWTKHEWNGIVLLEGTYKATLSQCSADVTAGSS